MEKQIYTLSIYTEHHVGLINKIAHIFSRRKINLLSLNTSPSEIPNIYRFTVVLEETEAVVTKLARQLEKLVDVFKVYVNTDDEIIWQKLALFKVPTQIIMKEIKVERLLREYGANAVVIREDFTVFELSGQDEEIQKLIKKLEPIGLIEFVQSGRVAIIKANEGIHKKVLEMEARDPSKNPASNNYLNHGSKIFQM